jgi:hypothetical protein
VLQAKAGFRLARFGPFNEIDLQAVVKRISYDAALRGEIPDVRLFDRCRDNQRDIPGCMVARKAPQAQTWRAQSNFRLGFVRHIAEVLHRNTAASSCLVKKLKVPLNTSGHLLHVSSFDIRYAYLADRKNRYITKTSTNYIRELYNCVQWLTNSLLIIETTRLFLNMRHAIILYTAR